MTDNDKKALMWKIIDVFECGSLTPKYSEIYIYADGPGDRRQLTIGRGISEYGNLQRLVSVYIANKGMYANSFVPYLSKIGKQPLVGNNSFKALLIKASKEDPIMRRAQDEVFEEKYFAPAYEFFLQNGFTEILSLLVILDSYVHSGSIPAFLRNRFPSHVPNAGGNERDWIIQYVTVRYNWLRNHSRKILQGTVYRTHFFKGEIEKGNWELKLPLVAHGVKIT